MSDIPAASDVVAADDPGLVNTAEKTLLDDINTNTAGDASKLVQTSPGNGTSAGNYLDDL